MVNKYPKGTFRGRVAQELGVDDLRSVKVDKTKEAKKRYRVRLLEAKLKIAQQMWADDPDRCYKIRDYKRLLEAERGNRE